MTKTKIFTGLAVAASLVAATAASAQVRSDGSVNAVGPSGGSTLSTGTSLGVGSDGLNVGTNTNINGNVNGNRAGSTVKAGVNATNDNYRANTRANANGRLNTIEPSSGRVDPNRGTEATTGVGAGAGVNAGGSVR